MKNKAIVIAIICAVLAASGFAAYSSYFKPVEANVSKVKNSPQEFLGPVKIVGKAGNVYADKGVVEIVDDKACCNLFLIVPFTEEQKKELGAQFLFKGALPSRGQPLEVLGKISESPEGYTLEVKEVSSSGAPLISRL